MISYNWITVLFLKKRIKIVFLVLIINKLKLLLRLILFLQSNFKFKKHWYGYRDDLVGFAS